MFNAGISWGYFFDHNPFEPHCNAHPNNFLILPDSDKILAPIDFDFSYEKKNFFSTIDDLSETFGKYDESLFTSWINQETYELDKSLLGMETMSNFKFNEEPKPMSFVEHFLRDQLAFGYRDSFKTLT